MKRNLMMVLVVAAVLAVFAQARADEKPKFVVIVHASSRVTDLSRNELKAIYLKKTTRWKDDTPATPFDLLVDAPVRDSFSTAVLDKGARLVQTEWRQRIFAGLGTPPRELRDDATVVATIAATPGAIGYVAASTALPATVRVVNLTQ
jgi:ABC-type phosphate transport system substrate-binding protein